MLIYPLTKEVLYFIAFLCLLQSVVEEFLGFLD
jgi:hypothetical protein